MKESETRKMADQILFIATSIRKSIQIDNIILLDIALRIENQASKKIKVVHPAAITWKDINKKNKPNWQNPKPWDYKGLTIYPISYLKLPFKRIAYHLLPLSYFRFSREVNDTIKIIHAHYIFPDAIIARHLSHKFNIPYIVSARQSDINRLERMVKSSRIYREATKVLRDASTVHVLNVATSEYFKKNFNLTTSLIPHGIDGSTLVSAREVTAKNKGNVVRICYAGILDENKRVQLLIDAVKSYKGNTPIELHIAGNGPLFDDLRSSAEFDDHIVFHDLLKRERVLALMKRSNIFCMVSKSETFGLAFIEAAACGNAIIGTKGQGIYGIFDEDQQEAMYIEAYEDFCEKLYELIENGELRTLYALNALSRAKSLSWETIISKYSHMYDDSISGKPR